MRERTRDPFINPNKTQEWLDEMMERLELQREEFERERARELPIPVKLYHATPRENLEKVIKEGLDPSELFSSDDRVVCLSDDKAFALEVAQETQGVPRQDLVILEIEARHLSSSQTRNYLRKEDPDNPDPGERGAIHEVHYTGSIPPDLIKILNNKERG